MSKLKYILIFILLVIVSLTVVVFANKWRSSENYTEVKITGNINIPDEDIRKIAHLSGDSSVDLNMADIDLIQARILKHPEIKKVFVSKEPPSEIKIEVIEKSHIAIVNFENEMMLIDEELELFPFKYSDKLYDMPVISGIKKSDKNFIDDLKISIYLLTNIMKSGRYFQNFISEISFSDSSKIIFYTTDKAIPIYLPRPENLKISDINYQMLLKTKIEVFKQFIQNIYPREKNIESIDLRYSNQVVMKYKVLNQQISELKTTEP